MDGIIDLTLKALVAFAIYAIVVLAYTGLGAYKNINIWQVKFDWRLYANGVAKWGVLGFSVLAVLLSAYGVIALAPSWGIELANAQQVAPPVIFGLIVAGIFGMLLKCVGKIAEITGTSKETLEALQTAALKNTDPMGPIILDVADLPGAINAPSTLEAEAGVEKSLIEKTVEAYLAEVGGRGAAVDTGSWAAFRSNVLGRAYDIDGYYGAQCWDGAALFWLNAVGRSFSTGGTGAARGGWEAARSANAGSEFELITDRNAIQPGDWMVFGGTTWGHVSMATSGNLGGYVKSLGQNQGGDGSGSAFNEINLNLGNFLGAFRLKRWHASPAPAPAPKPQPAPAPAPSPAPAPVQTVPNNPTPAAAIAVGDTVTAWGIGTGDSFGAGGNTRAFPETAMKVIGINNGRIALNQYNQGTPGKLVDVTAWWPENQVRK